MLSLKRNAKRWQIVMAVTVMLLACYGGAVMAQDDAYQASSVIAGGGGSTGYEIRLSNLEDQMRAVNGKVEQLEYSVRRLTQSMQRLQGDIEQRMAKLEEATSQQHATPSSQTAQQISPAPQPQQNTAQTAKPVTPANETAHAQAQEAPAQEVSGTLGSINIQGDKITGGSQKPKSPPLPTPPEDYGLTAQELYDKAFDFLRQAEYEKAEKTFKRFIDKYPGDKLSENARYWYAETFYGRGKFGDAAVAFAEAYQSNPRGPKAPDSLLKLAMAMAALDKIDDACTTLGEIKNKYPTAAATIRARTEQERARLKCGKKQ